MDILLLQEGEENENKKYFKVSILILMDILLLQTKRSRIQD